MKKAPEGFPSEASCPETDVSQFTLRHAASNTGLKNRLILEHRGGNGHGSTKRHANWRGGNGSGDVAGHERH